MPYMNNKGADQSAHPCSLISTFIVCCLDRLTNVLFLTFDNEFLGVICSFFRGRQNIFLSIFSTKFVVKCATKVLKIG